MLAGKGQLCYLCQQGATLQQGMPSLFLWPYGHACVKAAEGDTERRETFSGRREGKCTQVSREEMRQKGKRFGKTQTKVTIARCVMSSNLEPCDFGRVAEGGEESEQLPLPHRSRLDNGTDGNWDRLE